MALTDISTIADAFERCICNRSGQCEGCYLDGPGFGHECRQTLCREALYILQRMKPAKPEYIIRETPSGITYAEILCGQCGEAIYPIFSFCPYCGVPVEGAEKSIEIQLEEVLQ